MLRGMDDAAAAADHVVMNPIDIRPAPNHERKVLQAGLLRRIRGGDGTGVEEHIGTRFVVGRLIGELVIGCKERLEANQGHERVVITLRRREIRDVDSEMTEHR